MRKAKGIILLMLIFTLVFVSACGSNNNAGNNGANDPAGNEANGPAGNNKGEEPAEEPVKELPPLDMKGETMSIMLWYGWPEEGTQEGDLMIAREKELEQKYNVNIEWMRVPWGEPVNALTAAALTGEPAADIIALDRYHAIPSVVNGLLLPVDDYFDFDNPHWPKNIKEISSWNGKMYGFVERVTGSAGLYYNKTMLEREGLPDPHDLIAKGEWTWDAMLDIAKKLTRDTDGDGVVDQWGFVNQPDVLARIMIYANEGKWMDQRDGKWVYVGNEDQKTIEALRYMSDMVNVHKVIPPDMRHAETQTYFSQGKAAFVTGELWEGSQRPTMTDEQGFVYFPMGPSADEYVNTVSNFIMWYMPANAKRPAEVARIWEELILWDRMDNLKREDAEKQLLSSDKDIETMMNIVDFVQPLFIPDNGAMSQVMSEIWKNGVSPESAVEMVKQKAQDGFDTNLNK